MYFLFLVAVSSKMKYKQNIIPAGLESDDEYDEFNDYIQPKTHCVKPQVEDFKETLKNACVENNVPEIIRALKHGSVDINCRLLGNWTALMHAGFNGSVDAIKYLMENGADPQVQFDCHNVVMCVCDCSNNVSEINLLNCLKLVANFDVIDINITDRSGLTALMYACSNGFLKLVEFLVENGADIEIKDNQSGETALFFAVRSNHPNVVKFLISHGVDKDVTDKRNQTVHRIAESKNMIDILKLLNMDYADETQVYFSEERTYWDVVMAEMENGFKSDVKEFLEKLSMEIYANQLESNNTTLKRLLSVNKNDMFDMGVVLSPHRKLLTVALKCFHTFNWSNRSLGVQKKKINAENIAQILAIVVRQLHILDAQIQYLGSNSYGLDPKKGEEAMSLLMHLKTTESKIFKLLDKKVRIGQVDYIGPHKLKKQNPKISITEKVFVATAAILVLLRII